MCHGPLRRSYPIQGVSSRVQVVHVGLPYLSVSTGWIPVKQILPESSRLDLLAQIAVRGGNDPHIHLNDNLSTEPLDLSLLNHAQKIRLHGERKLTDFVQEDRAAILLFEQSFLLGDCAGESASLIAEQFTL